MPSNPNQRGTGPDDEPGEEELFSSDEFVPFLEPGGAPAEERVERQAAQMRKEIDSDVSRAAKNLPAYCHGMPDNLRLALLHSLMEKAVRHLSYFVDMYRDIKGFGTFSTAEIHDAACSALEGRLDEISKYRDSQDKRFDRIGYRFFKAIPLLENPALKARIHEAFRRNLVNFLETNNGKYDIENLRYFATTIEYPLPPEEVAEAALVALRKILAHINGYMETARGYFHMGEFESQAIALAEEIPPADYPVEDVKKTFGLIMDNNSGGMRLANAFGIDDAFVRDTALEHVRMLLKKDDANDGRTIRWITEAMKRPRNGKDPGYGLDVADVKEAAEAALIKAVKQGRSSVARSLLSKFKLDASILNGPDIKDDVKKMFVNDLEDGGERPVAEGRDDTVKQTFGVSRIEEWHHLGHIDALQELMNERALEALRKDDYGTARQAFEKEIGMPETFVPSDALRKEARVRMLRSIREGDASDLHFHRWCGAVARAKDESATEDQPKAVKEIDPDWPWDDQYGLEPSKASNPAATPIRYSTANDDEYEHAVIEGLKVNLQRSADAETLFIQQTPFQFVGSFLSRCDAPYEYLQRSEVRTDARDAALGTIKRGHLEYAEELAKACGIPLDIRTSEGKAAALEGTKKLLERNVEKAMALARAAALSDDQIAGCVRSSLEEGNLGRILDAQDILPAKVLARLENDWHLESFRAELGFPCVPIYDEYVRLHREGNVVALRGYVHKQRAIIDGLISSKPQDASVANTPNYKKLIEIAYPSHAGNWGSFDGGESCPDRSADLEKYVIKENYNFTLTPGKEMVLKDGRATDEPALNAMQEPIAGAQRRCEATGFDQEKMLALLDDDLKRHASVLQPADAFATREEKMFGLLLAQAVGRVSLEQIKPIMILYQFAAFEDIRAYLEGTRGRAEQAKNPQYAYLLELREFFSDRIKDVARHISDTALKNPKVAALLPEYFRVKSQQERERLQQESLNKLQIPKLGMAEGFLAQIRRTLEGRTQRAWTDDDVRALIRDYEDRTEGLAAEAPDDATIDRAVYGQIRKQRRATIQALTVLRGTEVNPADVHLGEINLAQVLEQKKQLAEGTYDEELFTAYIAQSIQSVFAADIGTLDGEIAKYAPKDAEKADAKVRRVEAYVTKNHTSAHARGTAGVCVASDNPNEREAENGPCIWNMPNYLQMVLRDAESKICQGAVLMHVEEDRGKKILTASINPSSTYLYQVNETDMFAQIRAKLVEFAKDNGFDAVAVSRHQQIRTNRTGGEFERAMNAAIAAEGKEHSFDMPRTFSTNPVYHQDVVDLIWSKAGVEFAERSVQPVGAAEPEPAPPQPQNPWNDV